ncbi:V-type ATP synthase subunit I [Roseibium denhamense]|uniref:V/A-type H+-transporting ATPase subunit I n=1 Tax=Roseibium denhamense TaxID=76305 RepID=A0ABY1PL82_9HYPH|nr:V-type ATP synthase subunit I [Roseibium denhamense]MTI07049.1 V-type ATP synthase subunit I [Roseibium denhamense]SMP36520.1 V/A-type H+-transporting ATPase subunit I [Roseibium denhamense]
MSIVPLTKVSLIGLLDDKEQVLEAAQAFGAFHLIPLTSAQKELEAVPNGKGREASEALRWLVDSPLQRRPVTKPDDFQLSDVVDRSLANRKALKACEDQLAHLHQRIQSVQPWGEFSFSDLQSVGGNRLWFYVVPVSKLGAIDPAGKTMEIVHRDKYRAYIVLLSAEEPPASAMPVARTHIGSESLSVLQQRYEDAEITLEDLNLERQALTKWRYLLARNLAAARDQSARQRAALETADTGNIFVLQAWARQDQEKEIRVMADERRIASVFEDVGEGDRPPTLLENPPSLAAGEDLVEFYQTPGYRDWDPSPIVYVSFVVFFGMIMTDAGYGLLLLGLLYLFRRRFAGSELGQRLFRMSVWLMVSTTAFGVATGSYFGISPPDGSLLAQVKILHLKDVDTMMKITLTIGVLHIVLANFMRSRNAHTASGKYQPLGWCLAAIGGLSAYLGAGTTLQMIGPVISVLGLLTVGYFGSDRPVDSVKTGGLRVFDGFAALARVVNIFSDVLSYMRLFALGLAAASLAETINSLSGQLNEAVPGIGVLIALIVLVIGHAINIGLGLIAGCVHGLRLNVIEFFNWSLTDEGQAFRPFRKEETRL